MVVHMGLLVSQEIRHMTGAAMIHQYIYGHLSMEEEQAGVAEPQS